MIYIDTGHGQDNSKVGTYDPGAVSGSNQEAKLVRQIADQLETRLREMGVDVRRSPDGSLSKTRMPWLKKNTSKNDLLLSLHMNGNYPNHSGIEVWYPATRPELRDTAADISKAIADDLIMPDRGPRPDSANRYGQLGILRSSPGQSFLIELGFIGNKSDVARVLEYGAGAVASVVFAMGYASQLPRFPESWAKMKELKVFSEFTKPGQPVDTDSLGEFLYRFMKV